MNQALFSSKHQIRAVETRINKKLLGQRRFYNHLVAGMRRSKRIAAGAKRGS